MLFDPLCNGGCFYSAFGVVAAGLIPGDAFALRENCPVFTGRIAGSSGKIGLERGHCPFDAFDRPVEQVVDGVGQLPIDEGIASGE